MSSEQKCTTSTTLQDMSNFVTSGHYARVANASTGALEGWGDIVKRVCDMHKKQIGRLGLGSSAAADALAELERAAELFRRRVVLGSGRSLQFAGTKILSNNARIYNCTATRAVEAAIFHRSLYLLLCGCGVGCSVQREHVAQMAPIAPVDPEQRVVHVIEDSIEGWADAAWALFASYFAWVVPEQRPLPLAPPPSPAHGPMSPPSDDSISSLHLPPPATRSASRLAQSVSMTSITEEEGKGTTSPTSSLSGMEPAASRVDERLYRGKRVVFDYSKVRPKGAPISGLTGKAPGPDPLRVALENVRRLLDERTKASDRLRPIDVFDILGHLSDAVLAGGIRRSAMIILFSPDDEEMLTAKTGTWYADNPQRARANISAHVRREDLTLEMMKRFTGYARQFGEPGLFLGDMDTCTNPCAEIALLPWYDDEERGVRHNAFAVCNLTEINVGACEDADAFYEACRAATIIGTIQATYTDFPYLGQWTEARVRASSLLGVSMTGICQNLSVAGNPTILRQGARIVRDTNKRMAYLLGIRPAARTTTVKPSGTATIVLGLGGSGIHPVHSLRYLRRVQVSGDDDIAEFYTKRRPQSVEKSAWSAATNVITFPIEFESHDANGVATKTKATTTPIELLELARMVQQNWVVPGTAPVNECVQTPEGIHQNVSLTVNVPDTDETWDAVAEHIHKHKSDYTGVSLLIDSSSTCYRQAPFETVPTPEELVTKYGVAALFASGLIVDIKSCFSTLHDAFDALNGSGPPDANVSLSQVGHVRAKRFFDQKLVIDRIRKFANKFMSGNLGHTINCLHEADAVYTFEKLSREAAASPIEWSELSVRQSKHEEERAKRVKIPVCSGDSCELVRM